jgi:hypothetical protein
MTTKPSAAIATHPGLPGSLRPRITTIMSFKIKVAMPITQGFYFSFYMTALKTWMETSREKFALDG